MTIEEAIEILKEYELNPCVPEDREAVDMAIKALEEQEVKEFNEYLKNQQPCGDCVSRNDALNAITMAEVRWQAIDNINKLPPVTPQKQELKQELKQEPILDKIRTEIADLDGADYDHEGYYKAVTDAVKIIDKYKAESEV